MNKADKSIGFARIVRSTSTPCVFISHKKEDEEIAVALGDFLMKKLHIDIYLDLYDLDLQEAVSKENDEKIVKSIKEGIELSDILLCIVSDNTRLSWWVPYEIGIADINKKIIASIKTKDIDDFPSFLKTKTTLKSIDELIELVFKSGRYGGLFFNEEKRDRLNNIDKGELEKYFE
jgi:hypothetical protein